MPYRTDPLEAGRHPFELFTLYLAFLTTFPTVVGVIPVPGTVADVLPDVIQTVWAWTLFLGALIALVGVYWRERASGLIAEQLGLAFAGLASVVYSGCAIWSAGEAALVPAALVGGFGVSCIRRYFDIQQTLDATHEVQKRREKGELV